MANPHLNTIFTDSLHQNILNLFIKENDDTYTITRALSEDKIITAAKALLAKRLARDFFIQSPQDCFDFLVTQMGQYESEVFCVVFLNNQHGVIAIEEMFKGTINQSAVYPREVVKQALKYNAASVIFAHNHPSGMLKASQADIKVTEELKKVLKLVDIKVLDHVIVAGGYFLSFVKEGLMG